MIAGCTPTIDTHHAVLSVLGERFLNYREGLLRPDALPHSGTIFGWSWHNNAGEPWDLIGIRVGRDRFTLNYGYRDSNGKWLDVTEAVPINWTACIFGGCRPWFRCPGVLKGVVCNRRVAKLYIRGYFVCR